MGEDQNVQDQNLVDDQVEQAISASTAAVTDAANALNGSVAEPAATGTGLTPPSHPASVPEPITSNPAQDNDDDEDQDSATRTSLGGSKPAGAPSILSDVQAAAASLNAARATDGDDSELAEVKRQALEQLAPLVTKIDLPPVEKFETLMSIIRAGDDKSLIKPAFEAAQAIADDDKKAQALLDVVNEVNYLTHPPEDDEDSGEEEA